MPKTAADARVVRSLGKYTLLHAIGDGGMASLTRPCTETVIAMRASSSAQSSRSAYARGSFRETAAN
jgi:hypothetical protein